MAQSSNPISALYVYLGGRPNDEIHSPWERERSSGILYGSVEVCKRVWASALTYIVPSPLQLPDPEGIRRLIVTSHQPNATILEQLDIFSIPTSFVTIDISDGINLEVSDTFLLDLGRIGEDQLLFIQGILVEPAQNAAEKVLVDLFDLVGRDKALLRTLTEICNQRAWIDLRNFVQDQYYRKWREHALVRNSKQNLSIYKDAAGTITINSYLEGDIVYECREGRTFKLKAAVGFVAGCVYNLSTQTMLYQHVFF